VEWYAILNLALGGVARCGSAVREWKAGETRDAGVLRSGCGPGSGGSTVAAIIRMPARKSATKTFAGAFTAQQSEYGVRSRGGTESEIAAYDRDDEESFIC